MMLNLGVDSYNPDVLSCISNLSNDEVFTPPELASAMLDELEVRWARNNNGENLWGNPGVRFLDPFTKSGVFLREITRRLVDGLAEEIPVLQDRINHIQSKQVFGIAITNMTALLSRRTLYCSRQATSKYSVFTEAKSPEGNIWFERTEHTWVGGTKKRVLDSSLDDEKITHVNRHCRFCGAREDDYDRGDSLESHAYAFIHSDDVSSLLEKLFGEEMHFDVVIGNPPYQLTDGGAGKSAKPIYHHFITAAKNLDPKFIAMITPSRWMAGGKGLDSFRKEMLADRRIRHITDYLDSNEAFPGVDIAGGVSYFLWDGENPGDCDIETIIRGEKHVTTGRHLDEYDILIRHSDSLSIVKKVWPNGVDPAKSLGATMSGRNAFGFSTNYRGKKTRAGMAEPVALHSSAGITYVERADVNSNSQWIDKWKASVSRASPAGGRPDKNGRFYGLSSIQVIPPNEVTTEAYPIVGAFDTEEEANRMCVYLRSTFLRFLLTLRSANQSVSKSTFGFVPSLPMDRDWRDVDLFEKFGISEKEQLYIASLIRPMEGESK